MAAIVKSDVTASLNFDGAGQGSGEIKLVNSRAAFGGSNSYSAASGYDKSFQVSWNGSQLVSTGIGIGMKASLYGSGQEIGGTYMYNTTTNKHVEGAFGAKKN